MLRSFPEVTPRHPSSLFFLGGCTKAQHTPYCTLKFVPSVTRFWGALPSCKFLTCTPASDSVEIRALGALKLLYLKPIRLVWIPIQNRDSSLRAPSPPPPIPPFSPLPPSSPRKTSLDDPPLGLIPLFAPFPCGPPRPPAGTRSWWGDPPWCPSARTSGSPHCGDPNRHPDGDGWV